MMAGIAAVSAALLMTELALTRIFSVTMYYHFAFLAISIALFGLSASGVAVYLARRRLAVIDARVLLSTAALTHALATLIALSCLVRIRVGLNYSQENLWLMLAIYALASLPFFTGGSVMSIAFSRMADRINVLYAADLIGAATGCLALIPLLNWLGAPGVVMTAAALSAAAAIAFAPSHRQPRVATVALVLMAGAASAQLFGATSGFDALVIGPGGGRDLLSALVFGASHVDGVEINPIIARDVMLDRFRDYSGGVYANPRVSIYVDDGRNFVRRSAAKYDVIQASLVDTWAATAAGAYTLTENSLYTKEAFGEYIDHLSDGGLLTITRWVFDGLRLVTLAQDACAERGLDASQRLAIIRYDRVATFLLSKHPFTAAEVARLRDVSLQLGFEILYAPGMPPAPDAADPVEMQRTGTSAADYRRLILAGNRQQFLS